MMDTNTHAEALKIARDLLMDEYVERVNQLEQRWAAEAKLHWMSDQTIMPYPDLPEPPSVDMILATAQMLLEFFNDEVSSWYPEPEPTPEPFPVPTPTPGNVAPAPGNVVMSTALLPEHNVPQDPTS